MRKPRRIDIWRERDFFRGLPLNDRVVDGMQLREAGKEHKSAKWKIEMKGPANG
jgi:hypothetical protein